MMEKSLPFIGECSQMCPADEIKLRIREELVHPLEKVFKSGRLIDDPNMMVKEYSRSAAGRHEIPTQDLRPGPVLLTTVEYLLGRISLVEGRPWNEVYDFIFDRLRAVRQDMTIQQIGGFEAITLLEYIVRFYIYSGYRLCEEKIDHFDPKINDQHTQECLKQLLSLYTTCHCYLENRAEFESLYLIFNLGQAEALQHYYDLPKDLREHKLMEGSYMLSVAYYLGNYNNVLKSLKSPCFTRHPLVLCAFHRNLTQLQRRALKIMSHGYSSKALRYPVQHLADLLWFDSLSLCVTFCEMCGLQVKGEESIIFLKSSYREPEKVQSVHISGIDSLLCQQSLGTLLLGKEKSFDLNSLKQSLGNADLSQNQTSDGHNYKPRSARGRGRGRGQSSKEDNCARSKCQPVGKNQGQKWNSEPINHKPCTKEVETNCDIKDVNCNLNYDHKDFTKDKKKQNFSGERNSDRTQFFKEQEMNFTGECWGDELFTEEDMKVT
ncbi:SAC3 domain-containing protein 1-like [Saccostrea echinata]|uniref:SAC3 domain-containing protein 1-like n=1 Tax=Saccostrea echinata TaxID=191078 RepID=UPI002A8240D3|nr:SAC3 domain-containing protein 1-like [Saccostrea echinata]